MNVIWNDCMIFYRSKDLNLMKDLDERFRSLQGIFTGVGGVGEGM